MMSSRKGVPELDVEMLNASLFPPLSSNACTDTSSAMWSSVISTADVTNEQETEESAKCCIHSFYRSAFDFPDLSSSLTDNVPEAASRASCWGHSTPHIIAPGSPAHVTAGVSAPSLSVYNDDARSKVPLHDIWHGVSSNASSRIGTDVRTSLKEGEVSNRIDSRCDSARAAVISRENVYPGPHVVQAATLPHERVMLADNIFNGSTGRTIGIHHRVSSASLQADGVMSPANALGTPSSDLRQPPPLPRYPGVLKCVNTLQQQRRHHQQGYTDDGNQVKFLQGHFQYTGANRGDQNNISQSSSQKGNDSTVLGHKADDGAMLLASPPHHHNILLSSPRLLPFEIDVLTLDNRQGDQFSVSGSRKVCNVHCSLQDALRYVPYVLGEPHEGSFSLLEGSAMVTTPNTSGWPFSLNVLKCEYNKQQVTPIFIQMFPCELRDRTIIVLNRVVEATCGPDIATVVGIEPRSETSFIALVRTNEVWLLIHKLRCRVLMDRHGFWYAENMEQYLRLKEYCEGVRRLPQQMRHFQTDGLPCMPLVVELSRSVNVAAVTSPPAAPSYDLIAPIVTMERHRLKSRQL